MSAPIVVITGASSGIGFEAAKGLAQNGAYVVLLCRDRGRGEAALQALTKESRSDRFDLIVADLTSQRQVRQAAEEISRRFDRIDALVNNAAAQYSQRTLSEDGIEMQFAANYLGGYLLTRLLLERLKAAEAGRVVNVSSRVHYRANIDFDDLNAERRYFVLTAYAQSKLANVLFTYELARRLGDTRVTVNCLHPGLVRTRLGNKHATFLHSALHSLICLMGVSPATAARSLTYLAVSPEVAGVTGKYFAGQRPAASAPATYDASLARRLWNVSAELVHLPADG